MPAPLEIRQGTVLRRGDRGILRQTDHREDLLKVRGQPGHPELLLLLLAFGQDADEDGDAAAVDVAVGGKRQQDLLHAGGADFMIGVLDRLAGRAGDVALDVDDRHVALLPHADALALCHAYRSRWMIILTTFFPSGVDSKVTSSMRLLIRKIPQPRRSPSPAIFLSMSGVGTAPTPRPSSWTST